MNKYLNNAQEELKRVDHLVYVSLKYTRTVDIIKSIIDRLINAFDFAILDLLDMFKEKKLVDNIPKSPGLRTKILRDLYKDQGIILEFIDFYHLLRDLSRADFRRRKEFRRHVTMTALLQDGEMEINIDIITDYYKRSKIFLKLVEKILETENKGDMQEMLNSSIAEVDFEGGKL